LVIADVIHDIESTAYTLASDKDKAIEIIHNEWENILKYIESGKEKDLFKQLEKSTEVFISY